jgi:hypothetical protein
MARRRNRRDWLAKRESRSVSEVIAVAFVAGAACASIFLFVFLRIGIHADIVKILPEFGPMDQRSWYEYALWIASAAVGILVFARVFRSGAESLAKKTEPRLGTTNSKPSFFAASVIAILAAAVAFCVSLYLSACIGVWTGLIELHFFEPYNPGVYERLMWVWSFGLALLVFWLVYRFFLINAQYFHNTSRGDSRRAVSE